MTTPSRTSADRYPDADPVEMTQVIGEPYETTDERGRPVGIAEHIVAVTGVVDEVGDVFVPGVFADIIRRGARPKGVSGHDWSMKVAKALEREEWLPGDPRIAERIIPALPEGKTWPKEAGAVYVKAQYNLRTEEGRRAYENAKFYGAEENYSVGYKVAKDGARKRGGRRYINKLDDWFEWSDVLHGANRLAFGLSVKGLLDAEMERTGGRLAPEVGPVDATVNVHPVEEKARLVRDSAYWGLPLGTPIRPGMKPRGPKAAKLRQAGQAVTEDAGTVEVSDQVQQVKPVAAGKRNMDKNPELWGQMFAQVVDNFHFGADVADLDTTEDQHGINKGAEYNPLDVMLDNAVTPVDVEGELRAEDWDERRLGDSDDRRGEIDAYIDDVVAEYRLRYQARLAEQNDTGDGTVPDVADEAPQAGRGARGDFPGDFPDRGEPPVDDPDLATVGEADPPSTGRRAIPRPAAASLSTPLATQLRDALAATPESEPLGNRLADIAPDGQAGIVIRGVASSLNAEAKRTQRSKNPRPQKRVDPEHGAKRSIDHFKLTPEQAGERADALEALAEALDDLGLDTPDPGDGFGKSSDYWRATAAVYRRHATPDAAPAPRSGGSLFSRLPPAEQREVRALPTAQRTAYLERRAAGDDHATAMAAVKPSAAAPADTPPAAEAAPTPPAASARPAAATPQADAASGAPLRLTAKQRAMLVDARPVGRDLIATGHENTAFPMIRAGLLERAGGGTGKYRLTEEGKKRRDAEIGDQKPDTAATAGAVDGETPAETRVLDTVAEMARPGNWVMLTDLRARLGDMDRAELDAALKRLGRTQRATLAPNPNGKDITPEDRESAVMIGGDQNHMISLSEERPSRGATSSAPDSSRTAADAGAAAGGPGGSEADPVAAELQDLVDNPDVRAVLASVISAPDVDTARQIGRDIARQDQDDAYAVQSEAGSVADFVSRDKRGYPAINKGLDKLTAFGEGVDDAARARADEDAGGPVEADAEPVDDVPDEEIISADEVADGESVAADALGLIEAEDGELEVTADVADRQDRVEALLEGGEAAVKALDDQQLPAARQDVVDELALQEELARRDRERRRARGAAAADVAETEPTEPAPDGAEDAVTATEEVPEGEDAAAAEPTPERPKTRPGLAGAAEDYADAIESGDEDAIPAARARLESSLRRSRSESPNAAALRDLLAGEGQPDPARLRELATALRDEARERRNAQARSRRLAKRLERERLRSLLGQIDAEIRNRGLSAPNETPDGDKIGPTEDDAAVLTAEDLAAGEAVAAGPVADRGVWSDLNALPLTVSGAHYEASINADPDQPDQYTYEYRITEPDSSVPEAVGSGKESTVDDARRAVIEGLTEAFNDAPSYRGVPDDERLPDPPGPRDNQNLPASNIVERSDDATDAGILSADDLAAGQALEEADDGQDRGSGRGALEEVPADGVRPDQRPGDVLPEPGVGGGAADRDAGGRPGAGAAARGDDSGPGRLAGDGTPGRGVDGAGGDGAAPSGVGPGRGAGDAGGPAAEGGPGRLRGSAGGAGDVPDVSGRADDAGLTEAGVTERDQPQPDVAAVNRVPTNGQPFTPTGLGDFAPSGKRAKLDANMNALRTLRVLQSEDPPRPATPEEQQTLARWAGWGGLPEVFDDTRPEFADEREELRALLSPEEWNAAKRNTLNAHYTDPRAVSAIWQAVQDLGITQGRVLEPGSGSGNFIGLAPEGMDMLGVELDPTTAAMSKYLYPDAEIRNESFARSRFPAGAFDATVGNVPFGDFKLTDRESNKGRHSIHNHFIIKSLKATRPGGVVAVLTSRYTMDSQDSKARAEMAEMGDLLGAVRLPTGSHRAASGTDVIEDVLLFRRREDGAEPLTDQSWVEASKQPIPSADGGSFDLAVNSYWQQHPEHVLGTMRAEKGRYGTGDLIVDAEGRADESLSEDLAAALRSITDDANTRGLGATQREGDAPELVDTTSASAGGRYEGNIAADTSSGNPATYKFTQVAGGEVIDITDEIPASARAEFADLLGLRATFSALLDAESATSTDTPRIVALRAELNARYERYVAQYGAITRYTYTKSGARQRPAAARLIRRDPKSAGIRALESNYDPAGNGGKGSWSRASIFQKRSAAPREIATTASNPKDALALSLETYGRIDLPAIGEMLGILPPQPGGEPNRMQDTSEVRAALGDLVFEGPDLTAEQQDLVVRLERARQLGVEPDAEDAAAALDLNEQARDVAPNRVETASEYLSGDVRRKLAVARFMARHDARYEANVAALENVVPADLGPAEIDARLGASWIPPDIVRDFVRDLHGIDNDRYNQVQVAKAGSVWTVVGPKHGNAATEEWGTDRRTASQLVQAMLEQRPIRITAKDEDGKPEFDLNATLAAQAKVEALAERFAEWAWEDPQRARKLADNYNWQFNSLALRNYDGAQRTFPGMAAEFVPRPHQVAAVERIVNEPTALLAHVVGAGKTAEMVMGTAELKRLGLARKPAIVVPNHMLEQFTREYLEIYPNANVLAAGSDDLVGDKRKEFVARAATGDWDAVILTQKAFEAIPMSADQQEAYIQRELADMKTALEDAQRLADENGDEAAKKTVKQMEKALIRAEEAMRKKLDKQKDSAVSFEQTGIDYLMVDEAHHYSNLRTLSNIPNAGTTGSDMATDLHMKMEYLRENNQSGRVATFATGTPVRNTVTQTYIMQRYLRPDLLRDAGLTSFDAWAATFGQVVEEMELKPEGTGFRQTSRFAKFQNVPELLRMMHVFADVKMADDLNLPTPNLQGGKTETVTVASSPELDAFIADLGERAEKVRSGGVKPEEDNMLKISGDGRKAALSMKLVGQDHQPGKIEAAADRISAIYADTKDRVYPADPKNPEAGDDPTPGGLQIVFLDLGTPKAAKGKGRGQSLDDNDTDWNGYEELRNQLVERGVPPEKVAFIHSAKNDAEKAEMFARARSGQISVLIGSTEKMGVGTNVQRRAVALHHLDAPWRPSDVEQRDGRIMRQGNLNEDVQVIRYVTEGSFDAYMWQTLERKAKFINQIMRGSLDVREIEDVGDTALSYAEVKALATGNPDLMAKAKVDSLRGKLERLFRTHTRTQTNNANMVGILGAAAEQADRNAEAFDAAAAARVDTRGEKFRLRFANPHRGNQLGDPVTKRDAAADGLRQLLSSYAARGDSSYYYTPEPMVVGEIGGHRIVATYERRTGGGRVRLQFEGVPGDIGEWTTQEIGKTNLLPRIERALEGFEARAEAERERAQSSREEAEKVRQRVGLEFPRMAELEAARAKADRLAEKMRRDQLRDQYRKQNTNWDDPEVAASLTPEVLALLRFDPQIDSDEFDSPLLERDTTTDPSAGNFDSAAARARIRATDAAGGSEPAAPAASEPVGDGPFRTVQELRQHLEDIGSTNVGFIDWDSVLLSPGRGLFMFKRKNERPVQWRIGHTGSGLMVAGGLPGGRTGTRDFMAALERVEGPSGDRIDWTLQDGDTVRREMDRVGWRRSSELRDAALEEVARRKKRGGAAA